MGISVNSTVLVCFIFFFGLVLFVLQKFILEMKIYFLKGTRIALVECQNVNQFVQSVSNWSIGNDSTTTLNFNLVSLT